MPQLGIRQMFEAGVHFGHQSRFWNPEMAPYIYGERNKIHIINLDTTLPMLNSALGYLKSLGASGGKVMFVGTKRAARESIEKNAERCQMPYVNHRWLGGMMTNFKTIRLSVKRYTKLQEQQSGEPAPGMSKKQLLNRSREVIKLGRNLRGIKDMVRLPEALFIVDVNHEKIAVSEALKLGIPIVAVVDTNSSCAGIDYVIPGNDDAIRAVDLYTSVVADAILEGIEMREKERELEELEAKEAVKGVIKVAPGSTDGKKAASDPDSAVAGQQPRVRMKNLSVRKPSVAVKENPEDKQESADGSVAEAEKGEASLPDAGEDTSQEDHTQEN